MGAVELSGKPDDMLHEGYSTLPAETGLSSGCVGQYGQMRAVPLIETQDCYDPSYVSLKSAPDIFHIENRIRY